MANLLIAACIARQGKEVLVSVYSVLDCSCGDVRFLGCIDGAMLVRGVRGLDRGWRGGGSVDMGRDG